MAEELHWTEARKETEWNTTVQYLASMGLELSKLSITREQVQAGFQPIAHIVRPTSDEVHDVEVEDVTMPAPA